VTSTPITRGAGATGDRSASLLSIAVIGVLAGFLAGMFGVGGGILIVPALVLGTGMSQRLAHGTSLAAVVPISISSVISYAAHGNVDWPVAVWLAIGAVAGAVVGTKLLSILPHRTLGIMFSMILLVSAVRLFVAGDADGRSALTVAAALLLVVIGFVTGVLAGLLGVGGGVVMVPVMILVFGIPPVIAKGTSAAVIIPTAIMGTWRNRTKGNTDLRAALVIGVAGIVTAAIGSVIADRMSDTVSNVLFAALLTIVALRLLWQLHTESKAQRATAADAPPG
jgi:uncharacterized membrane protein YfcA